MINTKISIYGLMIILAIIINNVIVYLIYDKKEYRKEEIIGALVYENIGIIIGGVTPSLIQGFIDTGNIDKIGLTSYGALIGAIISLFIFSIQFQKSKEKMFFTFLPSIPLMYAIGKVGCFLAGCCYGIKYSGFGSVVYKYSLVAENGVHYFPIQILESLIFILIFVYIVKLIKKKLFDREKIIFCIIISAFAKFILDFLRISHVGVILSVNQIISIWIIVICIYFKIKYKKEIKCNL